jgi:hypothetical protein
MTNDRIANQQDMQRCVVGRLFYVGTRLWTLPIVRFLGRALFKGVRMRAVSTVTVATDAPDAVADGILESAAAAVRLIEQVDPRRFRRMGKDVDRVFVTEFTVAAGAHFPGSRTCCVSAASIRDLPVANVAIVIVHEATHARLDAMGIRFYPDLRVRIELRCGREEIEFARLLDGRGLGAIDAWIESRAEQLRAMSKH